MAIDDTNYKHVMCCVGYRDSNFKHSTKMAACDSVIKFEKLFQSKLDNIEQMLLISPLLNYPEGCLELQNFQSKVIELQHIVNQYRVAVDEWKKEFEQMKDNHEALNKMKPRIDALLLYSLQHSTSCPEVSPKAPSPATESIAEENKENVAAPQRTKQKSIAKLNLVTSSQFNKLPRHVRGHLTLEQMNTGVGEVNEILKGKYEFLSKPRKTLSLKEDKRRALYLEQAKEVKGTAYAIFFVDEDIQQYGKMLKLKRKTKDTVFLILRHMGIVKEIHKGKLTRYAIMKC
uniref:SKA complex subunit 1 n=1 Tax=Phallusia mammillata TaxID=59560 RepID=A0A6F9DSX9_9ASCI|nr:spindle and kinetochore-associated protein 1-like [Phallusia mammillata]